MSKYKVFQIHEAIRILYLLIVLSLIHGISNTSISQVVNDNIENRIELVLNNPISSSTTDCTLQWECLNHSLTRKCIQYHNDQWFFFKTGMLEKYFINISNQNCRDLRGVQLLIIDGEPCIPESYKIKKCISLGNHDDVFIALDSLENQKEYLVLVDGYLHDFCSFDLELADKPKGIPLTKQGLVNLDMKPIVDFYFELSWSIPDSIANLVRSYEVYRRHETEYKSRKVHEIQQGFNAYGESRLDYVVDEILPDYGGYYYKIIGVEDQDKILISKLLFHNPKPNLKGSESANWLKLDMHYPKLCKLKISIYNATNQSLLYWSNFSYSTENSFFEHYIKEYIDDGIFYFRIEVENFETNEKRNHLILK